MLSVDAVVDAGTRVATSAGLDRVGMRAVAGELGVTPMALYRHVGDADSLHIAVVERLLADLPEVAPGEPWDQRCREWAHAARAVLAPTPGLARHVLLNWIRLPRVLVVIEGLVATLERDGPSDVDAVAGANAVFTHVLMRSQAEEAVRADGVRRDLATLRSMRAQLPLLWAHRDEYRRARLDEHFTYGLDALLNGLAGSRRKR